MSGLENKHIVVTVHGIRTFGSWQRRLERLLRFEDPQILCYHFQYGYFSALAFLVPFLRHLLVRRFRRELQAVIQSTQPSRLDIVGHSFGTHLIAWALKGMRDDPQVTVETIILAGSVLRSDFYWPDLVPSRVRRVVNDCGSTDSVLLLSQFLVMFTGMAGRVGFVGMNGPEFQNRYSCFGHGGYFINEAGRESDSFMQQHWLPLLVGQAEIEVFDDRAAPRILGGIGFWLANNLEPVKILIYAVPLILALLFVSGLYVEAELARQRISATFDMLEEMKHRSGISPGAIQLVSLVQKSSRVPLGRTNVLWLDDNRANNSLERTALAKYGLCFERAEYGADALRLFSEHPDRFALIVSDYTRARDDPMVGYAFLDEVKKRGSNLPFIFYTMGVSESRAKEAQSHGAKAITEDPLVLFNEVLDAVTVGRSDSGIVRRVLDALRPCKETG
ncbi:response regulator [Rhizobium laguerreae]